jgi:maleate isomerase
MRMMDDIRGALFPALEAVLTCDPDYVILGMSAETFWDGVEGSSQLQEKLEKTAKRGVAMGSDACRAALRAYGSSVRRSA